MTSSEPRDEPPSADDDGSAGEPRERLEFYSDSLAEPFRDQFEHEVTIDVYAVVKLDDGTHLQYWTVTHTDPEVLMETAESFPTTRDARLLSTVDDTHRLEVLGEPSSLFSTFDEFDGVTKTATYDEDGLRVVAEFPATVETGAVVDAVQDLYPGLDLVRSYPVETVDAFRRQVEAGLTDRQLTVLQLAYFSGYYASPRLSTGEELAARLGISKQAFHEHLRKAYAVVFEHLLENGAAASEVDT